MSNQTQTARVKPIAATVVTLYNLSMPTANTEYSQALNNSVKQLLIRPRNSGKLQLAYISGNTNVEYITINAGSSYFVTNLDLSGATVYLRSTTPSQVVEIEEWT